GRYPGRSSRAASRRCPRVGRDHGRGSRGRERAWTWRDPPFEGQKNKMTRPDLSGRVVKGRAGRGARLAQSGQWTSEGVGGQIQPTPPPAEGRARAFFSGGVGWEEKEIIKRP